MELINDPQKMQRRSAELKRKGRRIVFVPTMGALHEGHLSLVKKGNTLGDVMVMSIYLNPAQFGPSEDLSNYPSNLEKDLELVKNRGVDIVFCPTDKVMYPQGFQTYVEAAEVSQNLCGRSRPSHFKGVATVVLKLFNIVKPDVAVFGEKDYQQLQVIKRMVQDLNLEVEIVGSPTVREEDGLAMSSRNSYLSPGERQAARSINESLQEATHAVKNGERDVTKVISAVKNRVESTGIGKIDYVKICNPHTLKELETLRLPALLAVAAHFGKARLIDNCILDV